MHLALVTPVMNKNKNKLTYQVRISKHTTTAFERQKKEIANQFNIVCILHDANEKEAKATASALLQKRLQDTKMSKMSPTDQLSAVLNKSNEVAELKKQLEELKASLEKKESKK